MISPVLGIDHLGQREAWHLACNARKDNGGTARAANDAKGQKHSENALEGLWGTV